jgi:hypothetical protein
VQSMDLSMLPEGSHYSLCSHRPMKKKMPSPNEREKRRLTAADLKLLLSSAQRSSFLFGPFGARSAARAGESCHVCSRGFLFWP